MSTFSHTNYQGRLSPKLTSTSSLLFRHPIPTNKFFCTFYAQFCAILCVLSVNLGSWQSGIMTPENKKNINGVGKAHLHACISKLRIKRNRASVASEKICEKMTGRLYKANTCSSDLIFLPLISPNFYENMHAFHSPFFSRTQAASMLYGVDNRANTPLHSPRNIKTRFLNCKL